MGFLKRLACYAYILCSIFKVYVLAAAYLLKQYTSKIRKPTGIEGSNRGKVAIVTGGGSGIGYHISKQLAKHGVQVIIASPKLSESEEAIRKIKHEMPEAKVEFLHLDLSSLESIRNFVDAFLQKKCPLHILINNAGLMFPPYTKTVDGFELQLQVNYLGHVLLTSLLWEKLKTTGQLHSYSRVINVASSVHYVSDMPADLDNLNQEQQNFSAHAAYMHSKLAVVMATYYLQRQLNRDGHYITVNVADPGVVSSGLFKYVSGFVKCFLVRPAAALGILWTMEDGAYTSVHLALSSEVEGQGGRYFFNCTNAKSSHLSQNVYLQEELWHKTCDVLHLDVNWPSTCT
ncbi:dehydrogenase/reductase SDR family member on chromosome X isoform X2 [Lingula anatina]|uniref:Dehydrogenase/reductase SDR family member on chromosome X isoform X2 n=1 Tax=Lingula anatina TaxID=7574 RepID=A0A1S3JWU8_LINAN|nr:dehydrogenase/reductase SDR family member on chromosome X isoform X2 [Lingula anatina]|eukprot:XP_013414905.1 dehydrogenase/reductase SDR family member on chromosome X isoform X2 [Lingula anatina]